MAEDKGLYSDNKLVQSCIGGVNSRYDLSYIFYKEDGSARKLLNRDTKRVEFKVIRV